MKRPFRYSLIQCIAKLALFLFYSLLIACSTLEAQEWESYLLTDFDWPTDVLQCGVVTDSANQFHVYLITQIGTDLPNEAMYYMRVNPYGTILTDTVRLSFPHQYPTARHAAVCGDGLGNSWCLWADRAPGGELGRQATFFAGRDIQGNGLVETRLIDTVGAYEGPPNSQLKAAYRAQDSTIHVAGAPPPYSYSRLTTAGDTLIWRQRLDSVVYGDYCVVQVAPDNDIWIAVWSSFHPGRRILLINVAENGSQTVYYPLGIPDESPILLRDFVIDSSNRFHFLVRIGDLRLVYYMLDEDLSVIEERVFESVPSVLNAKMAVDEAGNCLIVWAHNATWWSFKDSTGQWTVNEEVLDPDFGNRLEELVAIGVNQWALFEIHTPEPGANLLLYMYTLGFPPNGVEPFESVACDHQLISAFPNPFNSITTLTLSLQGVSDVSVNLYDVTGRYAKCIAQGRMTAGEHALRVDAAGLPSGVYFVKATAGEYKAVKKVVLLK